MSKGDSDSRDDQGVRKHQERKVSGKIHVSGEIEAHIPSGAIEQYKAARQENTRRDNWRFFVECMTLAAVLAYTGITLYMYCATRESADAAAKAAEIAKQTLHISERAYLGMGVPSDDPIRKTITFQLVNTGHLQARDIKITVYRLTVQSSDPRATWHPKSDFVDFGREDIGFPSLGPIQSGMPALITSEFDKEDSHLVETGSQQLIMAGFATYNAGFEDEPRQSWSFCLRTTLELAVGKTAVEYCDITEYTRAFKFLGLSG